MGIRSDFIAIIPHFSQFRNGGTEKKFRRRPAPLSRRSFNKSFTLFDKKRV